MRKWITINGIWAVVGIVILAVTACSQEVDVITPSPTVSLESVTLIPTPSATIEAFPTASDPPISIIDTANSEICNLVHNINACFIDGQPPEQIPVGEYVELFIVARDDLSQQFNLDPDSIKIQMIEKAQWDDTSLGNPEPGVTYSQVIVTGFKMVLATEKGTYTYHTSMDHVVLVDQR